MVEDAYPEVAQEAFTDAADDHHLRPVHEVRGDGDDDVTRDRDVERPALPLLMPWSIPYFTKKGPARIEPVHKHDQHTGQDHLAPVRLQHAGGASNDLLRLTSVELILLGRADLTPHRRRPPRAARDRAPSAAASTER